MDRQTVHALAGLLERIDLSLVIAGVLVAVVADVTVGLFVAALGVAAMAAVWLLDRA